MKNVHFNTRRNATAVAVAAALTVMAHMAQAQEVTTLETVTVTGYAASQDSALDQQQASDNIVSVVHSDGIGQLPDINAAEALQRLPGVTVERDEGEGRFVNVRGLGANFNATTINGTLVPSTDEDARAISLDVIPSGIISSLEVIKTLTPDMDQNSLGGTVNVTTISAFDHKDAFYSLEVGANNTRQTEQTTPNVAGIFTNKFLDNKLGVAIGVNYSDRKFGDSDIETDGWDTDNNPATIEEMTYRDYALQRKRLGATLNLDYRPNDTDKYYFRTLYSRYADTETRTGRTVSFDADHASGDIGDAEAELEVKNRKETHKIASFTLGGEKQLTTDWKLAAAVGLSNSRKDTPDPFTATFKSVNDDYQVGFLGTKAPQLIGEVARMYDASEYELDELKSEKQVATDKERNGRIDLTYAWKLGGIRSDLKFGGKISKREKTSNNEVYEIDAGDLPTANPLLSDGYAATISHFTQGNFGPGANFNALRGLYAANAGIAEYNEEDSRLEDFTMHEDINAGYVMNTFRSGLWTTTVGVRVEATKFTARGTGYDDDSGTFQASDFKHDYSNVLPSLLVRRDFGADTSVRGAVTHSVVRPNFDQLMPGFNQEGTPGNYEIEIGNPNLKALTSRNFDLGVEHRLGYASVVSVYGFYKDIKNFAYQLDLAGIGQWASYDKAETFENGKKAHVKGVELNYMQSFKDILPGAFGGLLFGVNATFTRSDATLDAYDSGVLVSSRKISLPKASDRAFNVLLGYEAGPLSLRLAGNYKSAYLEEVGDLETAAEDRYVDAQLQVDFSAHYTIAKQFILTFEAVNLTNEKYYIYQNTSSLGIQNAQFGRTYKASLKFVSF